MKYLVIDVAAEHGGALSILKQFISKFREDKENEYTVIVNSLDFENADNIRFVKIPWVKKSRLHRIYFDSFYVKRLIKEYKPDVLFSLQNKGFKVRNLRQEIYFHNALFICEKRFSIKESRKLWIYQNVISALTKRTLKYADKIIVQAEWIKRGLASKWKIDEGKICVERPNINPIFENSTENAVQHPKALFYPANFASYKNHTTLIKACAELWEENGNDSFSLVLTGTEEKLPMTIKSQISGKNYPISFVGALSQEEMKCTYEKTALVFPSYIETVGLPLVEAKGLMRPIIAADCEYAHESVGEYEKVVYFHPFDSETLKLHIERTIINITN